MKTTIELPEALVREVKAIAATDGTTLRSIVEEALRREIEQRRGRGEWRPRPELAYGSGGLAPEIAGASWAEIRDRASRDRSLIEGLRTS